jgi:hypothetical protein
MGWREGDSELGGGGLSGEHAGREGLVLADVDGGHAGTTAAQRVDQRSGLDQPGAAGVD